MSLTLTTAHRNAYLSRDYVGANRPAMLVEARRVFLKRLHVDGQWTQLLTPLSGANGEWREIPGVRVCRIEQSFDGNGIATCTLEMDAAHWREVSGPLGMYHTRAGGWLSPFRSFAQNVPGLGNVPNEWNNLFATAAQIRVYQGYGEPNLMLEFTGLLDSASGQGAQGRITVTARDFGQLLVDCHLFGYNIGQKYKDPVTFVGKQYVENLEASGDQEDQADALRMRDKWVIIDDLAGVVRTILRWTGLPRAGVQSTGARLQEPTSFSRGEYLIDPIKKAQDICGYVFFMGEPTDTYPMGRPVFRRSQAITAPTPVAHFRHTDLLTDLVWTRDDEPLASIIRVRGKANRQTGRRLGGDSRKLVMGVYRPPWHVQTHNANNGLPVTISPVRERDARILRHVIHEEPLYKTEYQCLIAAIYIALQEALASVTATVQVPAHPGLQLDDLISVHDAESGIASRAWIASKQTTFENGKTTSWKQTLGVSMLDTLDVVEVVNDLAAALRLTPGGFLIGSVSGEMEAGLPVQDVLIGTVIDSEVGVDF